VEGLLPRLRGVDGRQQSVAAGGEGALSVALLLLVLPGGAARGGGLGATLRLRRLRLQRDRVGVQVVVAAAREVLRVGTGEIARPLGGELEDARRERGDERAIVRDEQHGAVEGAEALHEGVDGLEIQVVRGLVQDEEVRLLHDMRQKMSRAASPPESAPTGLDTSSPEKSMRPS